MALLIGLVIALPVGIYSAVRKDTVGNFVGRSVAKAVRQLLPTGDDERCCCQVSYSREETTRVR